MGFWLRKMWTWAQRYSEDHLAFRNPSTSVAYGDRGGYRTSSGGDQANRHKVMNDISVWAGVMFSLSSSTTCFMCLVLSINLLTAQYWAQKGNSRFKDSLTWGSVPTGNSAQALWLWNSQTQPRSSITLYEGFRLQETGRCRQESPRSTEPRLVSPPYWPHLPLAASYPGWMVLQEKNRGTHLTTYSLRPPSSQLETQQIHIFYFPPKQTFAKHSCFQD